MLVTLGGLEDYSEQLNFARYFIFIHLFIFIFWFCTCKKQSEKVYEQQLYLSWNFSFWQTKKRENSKRKNHQKKWYKKPYPESTLWLCIHYGQNCFIQDGIANIFTGFSVCCNLQGEKKNRKINTSKITQFLGIGIHRKNVPINFVLL